MSIDEAIVEALAARDRCRELEAQLADVMLQFNREIEAARKKERQIIGKWLEDNILGALLRDGQDFRAILAKLLQGQALKE